MNKEVIVIPATFLGIVLLTSMIPIIQVILMTLNGGLTYIVNMPFGNDKIATLKTTGIIFNTVLTGFALYLNYNSTETFKKILTSFLALFFGQGMMLFVIDNFLKEDDSHYFYWAVVSGTPMLLMFLVGTIKYRNLRLKQEKYLKG